MVKTIKFIRETLKEHSRTLWKHRCIALESKHKPKTRITLEVAKKFAKKLNIENMISIERIRNMTNKERKEIYNKTPQKTQDTQQQTEMWDHFALQTKETENNRTTPKFKPQELPCTPTPKQTCLEATLSITKIKPEPTKKQIIKNKKTKQEQLLKITDAWKSTNEKQKSVKNVIKKKQKQRKWKEHKGDHDDVCGICNKAGELILCYTCSRCNHWGCDRNMSTHVHNPNIMYRCPTCIAENGNTIDGPPSRTMGKT